MLSIKNFLVFIFIPLINIQNSTAQRMMENLGRGAVSVKTEYGYFISWRLLGNENRKNIHFNIYRNNIKINSKPITVTNFQDSTNSNNNYYIGTVIDGKEIKKDKVKALKHDYIEVPLKEGKFLIQHAWPADLDGDGEFDYVISRLPTDSGCPVIEAYSGEGNFMWRIYMGPKSVRKAPGNGENDSPPASISGFGNVAGYRDNDNLTVYDLDCDGKAEIYIRTAGGVIFADGKTIKDTFNFGQYISVIDGLTGNEITRTPVPNDFINDGPIAGHFGIAYLDGIKPSLITKLRNRKGFKQGNFNLLIAAWDFDGKNLSQRWKWVHSDEPYVSSFHQIRILDLNQDGKDEICDGSYVIDSNGKYLYSLDSCVHGDRFFITDMDPDRPGLEGYCIQQTENGQIEYHPWYYFDATRGTELFNGGKIQDVGRGCVADIDPRFKGCEMWSINGIYSVNGEKISNIMPIANFRIWWDGDLLSEILDKTNIFKWDYINQKMDSIYTAKNMIHAARNAPPLYGDLFGDWREEVLWESSDHKTFRIYTTTIPTKYAFYTLLHNPAYRICLTVKGYYQSNLPDFYFGEGMQPPNEPKIQLIQSLK